MFRLPAEWEAQDAVIFAWPDEHTDWCHNLNEVRRTYLAIFLALCPATPVILLVRPSLYTQVEAYLSKKKGLVELLANLKVIPVEFNDTWTRDYAPITRINLSAPRKKYELIDFQFNAWGNKFSYEKDNAVTESLYSKNIFSRDVDLVDHSIILEGGSIESDGNGTLLTTTKCLLNKNRNKDLCKDDLGVFFDKELGCNNMLWLENGDIIGDDTDSHIDTLARFAPNNTIVYQSCSDESDPHFFPLKQMAAQLASFLNTKGKPFNLIALPLPTPKYNTDGERLPATYANFLVSNNHVLVPTYTDKSDQRALEIMAEAYSGYTIIGIECSPLIQQHGSLHCISMQLPFGCLKPGQFQT
ncbi:MAG: agmatine deiminase family protein [Agarilytica sp.]